MNKKILVYVSAPYSQGDVALNIRRVIEMADKLLAAGYIPLVPHLTALWDLISPKSRNIWMEIDKVYLSKCDAVLRLDGPSIGANLEIRYAGKLGKPVYYSLEELKGG